MRRFRTPIRYAGSTAVGDVTYGELDSYAVVLDGPEHRFGATPEWASKRSSLRTTLYARSRILRSSPFRRISRSWTALVRLCLSLVLWEKVSKRHQTIRPRLRKKCDPQPFLLQIEGSTDGLCLDSQCKRHDGESSNRRLSWINSPHPQGQTRAADQGSGAPIR